MKNHTISWPPLIPGILIKRYKRFLADIQLDTGQTITAHCPNSGSMATCAEPGKKVYVSESQNPKRKTAYSWELIDMESSLVGVNAILPNKLVKQAVINQQLPEFRGYPEVVSEPRLESGSRLDLALTSAEGHRCFIEIKNCTLVENNAASFPDAVTKRGLKHLVELQRLVATETRCAMVYLIQRMDAESFQPADNIDPTYGKELRQAARNGVDVYAYDVSIDLHGISINRPVRIIL